MTDEAVKNLPLISSLQTGDLFYIIRPGAPYIDYKGTIDQVTAYVAANIPAGGTVTSVAVSGANGIGVSGSPITGAGTIALSLGSITPASINTAGQIASTLATGTAPLSVVSTTKVSNLYADRAALADTVTTNANLIGVVTSVGNTTTISAGSVTNAMLAGSITASKLVGTDITTIGVVTIGTWNGTAITDAYIASSSSWNAKIGGSTGSTDNQLLRSDGTGGSTAQATGITVSDANEISGFLTLFNNQSGTTYTLVSADSGKTVTFNNSSSITVTLPNNLPTGFTCECIQLGVGQVTFAAAAGATLNSYSSLVKLAGGNAAARLVVTGNSGGASSVYNLAGNIA